MNDLDKRTRLKEILSGTQGEIAPGITDPLWARLAQDCGYRVVHLSGNAIHKSLCLPDRNLVTITEIESRAARIADATDIPLIVDLGGNHDSAQIGRATRLLERAGVAAIRIEDSYLEDGGAGRSSGPGFVPPERMSERIKSFADSRSDPGLVLIVRCDARKDEGLEGVHERLRRYAEAGADALGVQLSEPAEFSRVAQTCSKPLVTLWPRKLMSAFEFLGLGVRIALLPSAVSVAAVAAARRMLLELRRTGREGWYAAGEADGEEGERWYRRLGE